MCIAICVPPLETSQYYPLLTFCSLTSQERGKMQQMERLYSWLCFLTWRFLSVNKLFSRILFTTLLLACIFLTFASPTAHSGFATWRPIYAASTDNNIEWS